MGYNETIFGSSDSMFGTNLTLMDYMRELDLIDHSGPVETLSVVWYNKDGDIYIDQIYDHDTGEVYWDYDSIGNMDWTDNDDKLVGSLIMWGNLESTII